MRTLKDLEVVAMVATLPCDHSATRTAGGDVEHVKPGFVAPWERNDAANLRDRSEMYQIAVPADAANAARRILARVFDLPARAPADVEPIMMRLVWESDVKGAGQAAYEEECSRFESERRVQAALLRCLEPSTLSVAEMMEALCAEVLELRRLVALDAEIPHLSEHDLEAARVAAMAPESERIDPFIDPSELALREGRVWK